MFSVLVVILTTIVRSLAQLSECMSIEDARQIAANFENLQGTYNRFSQTLAMAAFAPNFTYTSASVITLINSGCTRPVPVSAVLSMFDKCAH
jgi:hypothetical protein